MNFLENPLVYVNLVQELMKIVEDCAFQAIREKTQELLGLLHLEDEETSVSKQLLGLFQDFHHRIFALTAEKKSGIREIYREKARRILEFPYVCFESNETRGESASFLTKFSVEEEIAELFANEELERLICSYFSLCLHMFLHEPPLKTGVEPFETRKFAYVCYKKNEFYCIDGFVKENAPAIVVVPPVMRTNFPYNGIRAAVLIVSKEIAGKNEFSQVLDELKRGNTGKCREKLEGCAGNQGNIEENTAERGEFKENQEIFKENRENIKENRENFEENRENAEIIKENQGNCEISKELLQNNKEIRDLAGNPENIPTKNSENPQNLSKYQENTDKITKECEFPEENAKHEISFELLSKDFPANFKEIALNRENPGNSHANSPEKQGNPALESTSFNEKAAKNETFSRNFEVFSKKMTNSKKAKTLN